MDIIIRNATTNQVNKSGHAVDMWIEEYCLDKKVVQRVTVQWLSENACFVYSKGEKDKQRYNVPGNFNRKLYKSLNALKESDINV